MELPRQESLRRRTDLHARRCKQVFGFGEGKGGEGEDGFADGLDLDTAEAISFAAASGAGLEEVV